MSDKEALRKISSRTDPIHAITSEQIQKLTRWRSSNSVGDRPTRRISQTKQRSNRAKQWNLAKGVSANGKPGNGANSHRNKTRPMETTDTEIHELFQLMDVNKDQKLAPKELDCVLRALGINATEADLIEFIGELPTVEEGVDKDCVTYEQFAESIKKNMALTNETDSLQVTFNAFDHAGDGFIDTDKLKSVLSNLGLQFQDADIQNIIHQVGSEGRISLDDFQRFMLNSDDII
ncbi:calmodulin-like [Bolinopsis microptera]|uniref:calmodulin-like n=1 Tax=Bolinopsis microptera TaxID=2820187 RepID=UPI00307A0800